MQLYEFQKSGTVTDETGHRTVGRKGDIAAFDKDVAALAEDGLLKPVKAGKAAD